MTCAWKMVWSGKKEGGGWVYCPPAQCTSEPHQASLEQELDLNHVAMNPTSLCCWKRELKTRSMLTRKKWHQILCGCLVALGSVTDLECQWCYLLVEPKKEKAFFLLVKSFNCYACCLPVYVSIQDLKKNNFRVVYISRMSYWMFRVYMEVSPWSTDELIRFCNKSRQKSPGKSKVRCLKY